MTNPNALSSRWAEVVGLAWADDDFRQRLLNDPEREMAAMGIELEGVGAIRVVEETQGETVLVVPRKPAHIQAKGEPKPEKPGKPKPPSQSCGSCGHGSCGSCDPDNKPGDDDDCKKPKKPPKKPGK
jgi:hypothetical protein